MKIFKNWKKTAAIMTAGFILASGFSMPALAHGHHGGGHHSSYTGTYCAIQALIVLTMIKYTKGQVTVNTIVQSIM